MARNVEFPAARERRKRRQRGEDVGLELSPNLIDRRQETATEAERQRREQQARQLKELLWRMRMRTTKRRNL